MDAENTVCKRVAPVKPMDCIERAEGFIFAADVGREDKRYGLDRSDVEKLWIEMIWMDMADQDVDRLD